MFTGEIIKGIAERVENPNVEIPKNIKNYKPLDHYVINVPTELVEEKVNNKVYLSDFLLDLGDNCIFEKQLTGCGGTTLALDDERNCIIVMPRINSVISKEVVRDGNHEILLNQDGTPISRPDTLCIYSGHNDSYDVLKEYIDEHTSTGLPVKIVCTYDHLYKLLNRLRGKNDDGTESDSNRTSIGLNWSDWFLYIDEMQAVNDAYGDRQKGEKKSSHIERKVRIRKMLKCIGYFKHVVFITATPLKEEYFFQEIFDAEIPEPQIGNDPFKQTKRFSVVKVIFPKECIRQDSVIRHRTKRVSASVAKHLQEAYIKNENYKANAHVFINSIDGILEIIRRLNVVENGRRIKIVCGQNEENKEEIKESIKKMIEDRMKRDKSALTFEDYIKANECEHLYKEPVSSINEPPKRINFYTSTAFEGADIFDPNGKIIVVSYGFRAKTMYDISTKFLQIAGRIRDIKFNRIEFFFDGVRYEKDENGKSDFAPDDEEAIGYREYLLHDKNSPEEYRRKTLNLLYSANKLDDYYISQGEDGNFFYDIMLENNDRIKNDVWNDYKILSNKVIDPKLNPFSKNGLQFLDEPTDEMQELISEIAMFPKKRFDSKTLTEVYLYLKKKELVGLPFNIDENAAIDIIDEKYHHIIAASMILGADRLSSAGLSKDELLKETRNAVIVGSGEDNTIKNIKDFLAKWVRVGDFMSAQEKKRVAQDATKKFGVKIKIEDFFDVVLKTTRDKRFCNNGETKKIPFIIGWKQTLFD